ncbi:hypothetical protein DV515_00004935, partial [Chloebia gouldiae]
RDWQARQHTLLLHTLPRPCLLCSAELQAAREEKAAAGQERLPDLVGLGGDEVDELGAAVDHQLPGVVGHADVGQPRGMV